MKVALTQPVEIALRTLGEEDRRNVLAWLGHLKDWKKDAFVREHSHKLESVENVYVLQTNSDMVIFFSPQDDQILVLDIATKATIKSFASVSGGDAA